MSYLLVLMTRWFLQYDEYLFLVTLKRSSRVNKNRDTDASQFKSAESELDLFNKQELFIKFEFLLIMISVLMEFETKTQSIN